MSKKSQDNDGREESLADEQKKISSEDPVLEDGKSSDDTNLSEDEKSSQDTSKAIEEIEAVEIEEVYEEVAEQPGDPQTESRDDKKADPGFEQKPLAPVSENESKGKGMAGTAMGLSLLALAGTGYNLYDSGSVDTADTDTVVVDFSGDIASIQEQIESLMQSQEELSVMATSLQTELAAVTEQVAAAGEPAMADEIADTATDEATDTSTASVDETVTAEPEAGVAEPPAPPPGSETADTETEATQTAAVQIEQADSGQLSDEQNQSDASALDDSAQQQIQQTQADALATLPSGDEIKKMALEQVSIVLDDANRRFGLNQAAQLLSIGEQRLMLAGDIGAAQAAFSMADQRLSEISDPAVEQVRESIASHLAALESLEVVDKNALTQELADLSGSVDSLAFKPLETISDSASDEQAQADAAAESAAGDTQSGDASLSVEGAGAWLKSIGSKVGDTIGDVGSGIASDLKSMVTIQKTGPLSDVLLAPEQQYFIRENIKLQLASAQRAVLQDNTGMYQQSLAQAQSMLNDFFDAGNQDVQSVSARLQELGKINLDLEIPDVSAASASLGEMLNQLPPVGSSETSTN